MSAHDLDMQDYNFEETLKRKGPEFAALLHEINTKYKRKTIPSNSFGWDRSKTRPFRLALLEAFKFCFWCGRLVREYYPANGETMPDDAATLDHTVSRFFRQRGEWVPKVLCCYNCNQARSRAEQKELSTRYTHMKHR